MDYHKIILKCRVCLAEEDENDMHELFPKYSQQNNNAADNNNAIAGRTATPRLCEKVEFCCGVRIRESPEMPTKICFKCFDLTRMWYNFRQICLNSQVYFESSCHGDSSIPIEIRKTLKTENDVLQYLLEDLQSFRNEMRQTYTAFANEVANIASVSEEDDFDDNYDATVATVANAAASATPADGVFNNNGDGVNIGVGDNGLTGVDNDNEMKLFEQIELAEMDEINDNINGNDLIQIKNEIMDDDNELQEFIDTSTKQKIKTNAIANVRVNNFNRPIRKVSRTTKVIKAGVTGCIGGGGGAGAGAGAGAGVNVDDNSFGKSKITLKKQNLKRASAALKVHGSTMLNTQKKNLQNKIIKPSLNKKIFRPESPAIFMCSICGNVYNKKTAFTYHMTLHKNIKPHECEICGKAFRQVCELRNHMRRHTGEKPFKCSYCDRHFIDRSEKLRHERVHTNTRPYVCQVCGKSFMHSAILKNHSKLHSGEKDFNCLVCEKAFTLQHQLKAHLSTITHKQKEQQFLSAGYEVVYE